MLGTLRVFLAAMVALSHTLIFLPESNKQISQWIGLGDKFDFAHFLGACSVSGFFIISGFVMTQIIYRHYGKLGRPTLYFYLDRFLRIFPQFLFFLALTLIFDLGFHLGNAYLRGAGGWSNFLMSAALVPLNYAEYIPAIVNHQLMPQAWSLALEEQYYWLFPLLILDPYIAAGIAIISYGIFFFASNQAHYFYYQSLFIFRFLPGVLFIFMFGKFLADYNLRPGWRTLSGMALIVIGCAANILFHTQDTFFKWISFSASIGVIVFGPLIYALSCMPRRKWDTFLGNSAYGVFLSHYFFLFIFVRWQILSKNPVIAFAGIFSCAFIAGILGHYFIERYFDSIRYRLRQRLH
jgi:peptidoglycan/LPS O-acetylase OafA/YrhL